MVLLQPLKEVKDGILIVIFVTVYAKSLIAQIFQNRIQTGSRLRLRTLCLYNSIDDSYIASMLEYTVTVSVDLFL